MSTYPAPKPIRRQVSREIQQSAREAACSLRLEGCLPGNETVVLAHIRVPGSAGIGRKGHDLSACYACAACHDRLDGRAGERPSDTDILRALIETQDAMLAAGLIRIGGR